MKRCNRLGIASSLLCLAAGCGMQLNAESSGFGGDDKKYCSRADDGQKVCFATEEERVADYQRRQREHVAAHRSELDARAAGIKADDHRRSAEHEAQQHKVRADAIAYEEKREAARLEHQKQQEAATQEAQAKKDRIRAMAGDKAYAVPVLSAMICRMEAENRSYAEDMQREKRVTAASGVMNLKDRRDIAESVDGNRSEITRLTALLRSRHGAARMPCKDVWPIVECNDDAKNCTGETREYGELWRYGQSDLDPNG